MRCPCLKCQSKVFHFVEDVKKHPYKHDFDTDYCQWTSHGKAFIDNVFECRSSMGLKDESNVPCNLYHDMVIEAARPNFNLIFNNEVPSNINDENPLNIKAQEFYNLFKATKEPLYQGCKTHIPLSAMSRLLNINLEYDLSGTCFNHLLDAIKEFLPEDVKLPKDFYKTK